MADGVIVDTYTIATDDAGAAGHVQLMKVAYSANGSASLVTADASGLTVQLGASLPVGGNTIGDVTVSSLPALAAGTNVIGKLAANAGVNIGDVSIPSSLPAGTAYIGKTRMTDGTTDADIIDLGTYAGPGQYILDGGGDPVTFPSPAILTASTTDAETSSLDAGDSIHDTILSFAGAAAASGGTGHIIRAMLLDKDDQGIEADLYLFAQSVTVPASDAAWSLSDADAAYLIDTITFSAYEDHANNQTSVVRPAPPIPYYCSGGTTLYGHLVTRGTPTYTATGLTVVLQVQPD